MKKEILLTSLIPKLPLECSLIWMWWPKINFLWKTFLKFSVATNWRLQFKNSLNTFIKLCILNSEIYLYVETSIKWNNSWKIKIKLFKTVFHMTVIKHSAQSLSKNRNDKSQIGLLSLKRKKLQLSIAFSKNSVLPADTFRGIPFSLLLSPQVLKKNRVQVRQLPILLN